MWPWLFWLFKCNLVMVVLSLLLGGERRIVERTVQQRERALLSLLLQR